MVYHDLEARQKYMFSSGYFNSHLTLQIANPDVQVGTGGGNGATQRLLKVSKAPLMLWRRICRSAAAESAANPFPAPRQIRAY